MAAEITAKIIVEITDEQLKEVLCTIFESGISWLSEYDVNKESTNKCEFSYENAAFEDGELTIYVDEPFEDDENGNGIEEYYLTKEKLLKGIKMYIEDTDVPYNILCKEDGKTVLDLYNIDGDVADIVLQYALFDDYIYG